MRRRQSDRLSKGAYKVELVTFTANGTSYEDTRTFHTCVRKHKTTTLIANV